MTIYFLLSALRRKLFCKRTLFLAGRRVCLTSAQGDFPQAFHFSLGSRCPLLRLLRAGSKRKDMEPRNIWTWCERNKKKKKSKISVIWVSQVISGWVEKTEKIAGCRAWGGTNDKGKMKRETGWLHAVNSCDSGRRGAFYLVFAPGNSISRAKLVNGVRDEGVWRMTDIRKFGCFLSRSYLASL